VSEALAITSAVTLANGVDMPRLGLGVYEMRPAEARSAVRWALQRDVVVIPKSARRERIVENASVYHFALDDADMAALDSLHEDLRTSWDPTDAP
jgi:diketogulonate reductase-like aldo/keto reductase